LNEYKTHKVDTWKISTGHRALKEFNRHSVLAIIKATDTRQYKVHGVW
jgi:hypothetical protein